ncbi:sensor domain-containing phosphodiesterase [Chitinimonas naiadis]
MNLAHDPDRPQPGLVPGLSGLVDGNNAGVNRILHAARTHLGMDIAFVSEFEEKDRIFRHVDAQDRSPIHAGDRLSLDQGYCQLVVKGLLPELIPDTSQVPAAMAMPETTQLPIGAHLSVPIHLGDGRLYGTFCCFSYGADPSLNERDLQMMRICADLVAYQIDAELALTRQTDEKFAYVKGAINQGGPAIVYQPIYRLESGKISGMECLSRFDGRPLRTPDMWFADAAQVGLGVELELSAIRKALAGLDALPDDVYLAINSSPDTVLSGRLTEMLEGISGERLVLEITEHAHVPDYQDLLQALAPLRARGVKISIDDAGAGYSSMSHILNMRPDLIKLDMSLTRKIDSDMARYALAAALSEFARKTGADIVAEGVETAAELRSLRSLGIVKAQGYYLSRPQTLPDAVRLLAANSRQLH